MLTITSWAQKEPKQLVGFQYDNDVFSLSDRYYSFGNVIHYRRRFFQDFIFKKNDLNNLQLNIMIGQQGFTPDNFNESDVSSYDYPFAGWLFLNTEIANSNTKNALTISFEIGVTGEASLADWTQESIHELFNFDFQPQWTAQIPSAFLVNLKSSYNREFGLQNKNGFLNLISSGVLGLKDVYVEQQAFFSFGKRNALLYSSLFNNIAPKNNKEYYGFLGLSYRYVIYNHLIEGSFFNNEAPFTLPIENQLLKLRLGGSFSIGNVIIKFEHNFETSENKRSRSHDYTMLTLEYLF